MNTQTNTNTTTTTNENTLFQSAWQGHNIRILGTAEAPLFIAQDVCEALGISKYRDAYAALPEWCQGRPVRVDAPGGSGKGGSQSMSTLTEAGFYYLVLRSNKPNAQRFAHWVCSEVLPSIRQHGFFLVTGGLPLAMRQLQALELQVQAAKLRVDAELLERRAKCARILPGSVRIADWLRQRHPHLSNAQLGPIVQRTKRALDTAGLPTGSVYSRTARRSTLTALPTDLEGIDNTDSSSRAIAQFASCNNNGFSISPKTAS